MTSCDPDTANFYLYKRQLVGGFCFANHLVSPTLNAGRKKIGIEAGVVNGKNVFLMRTVGIRFVLLSNQANFRIGGIFRT